MKRQAKSQGTGLNVPSLFSEEEQAEKSILIAFAALIQAYGQPIEIPREWVESLPENFIVAYAPTKGGRIFWIEQES